MSPAERHEKRRDGSGEGSTEKKREQRGVGAQHQGLSAPLTIWRSAGTLPAWLVERQGHPLVPLTSILSQCPASGNCWARGDLPISHTQAGLPVLTSIGEPLHPVLKITQVTVTLPGVVPNLQQLQAH